MSLLKLPIINNYDLLNVNRSIYSNYKCNCVKFWKKEEIFKIYKANKEGITKIFESETQDPLQNIKFTVDLIGENVSNKLIVSGGHTVVNLKDRFHISNEVYKSVEFSFKLIEKLQKKYDKKAQFLVQLNDFYMEKDEETDKGLPNRYRKEALNPYIIPPKINEFLIKYSQILNRKLDLYFCSEKNMADSFKRHIKNKKKNNDDLFLQNGDNWNMIVDNERFEVITNNKPNCVAATLRSIRYEINNNKIKDNFTTYIGIFPLCSIDNVLNGYKAAKKIYQLDLPTYFIFFGKSCF